MKMRFITKLFFTLSVICIIAGYWAVHQMWLGLLMFIAAVFCLCCDNEPKNDNDGMDKDKYKSTGK